eukprot:1302329-Pleurochrysis_carterae.AAC.1
MLHRASGFRVTYRSLLRAGYSRLEISRYVPTSVSGCFAGGRTHLVSPIMAAAAAVTGKLSDVRKLELWEVPVPQASSCFV